MPTSYHWTTKVACTVSPVVPAKASVTADSTSTRTMAPYETDLPCMTCLLPLPRVEITAAFSSMITAAPAGMLTASLHAPTLLAHHRVPLQCGPTLDPAPIRCPHPQAQQHRQQRPVEERRSDVRF